MWPRRCSMVFAVLLWILFGCSQGGFHDSRDYFQSIYGLSLQPLHLAGSSFIGRVVDPSGQPLPASRIFLQGSPLYTTSNGKGGFYLSGLHEGKNTIYILSANGLGRTLEIDVSEGQWVEDRAI